MVDKITVSPPRDEPGFVRGYGWVGGVSPAQARAGVYYSGTKGSPYSGGGSAAAWVEYKESQATQRAQQLYSQKVAQGFSPEAAGRIASAAYYEVTGGGGQSPYESPATAPTAQPTPTAPLSEQQYAQRKETVAQALARSVPSKFSEGMIKTQISEYEQQRTTYERAVEAYNVRYGGRTLSPGEMETAISEANRIESGRAALEAKGEFVGGQVTAYNRLQTERAKQAEAMVPRGGITERIQAGVYQPEIESPDMVRRVESRIGLGLMAATEQSQILGEKAGSGAITAFQKTTGIQLDKPMKRFTMGVTSGVISAPAKTGLVLFGFGESVKMGAEYISTKGTRNLPTIAVPVIAVGATIAGGMFQEAIEHPARTAGEIVGTTAAFKTADLLGSAAVRTTTPVYRGVESALKVKGWQLQSGLERYGIVQPKPWIYVAGEAATKQATLADLGRKISHVKTLSSFMEAPAKQTRISQFIQTAGYKPSKPIVSVRYLEPPTTQTTLMKFPAYVSAPKPSFGIGQKGFAGMGVTGTRMVSRTIAPIEEMMITAERAGVEVITRRPYAVYIPTAIQLPQTELETAPSTAFDWEAARITKVEAATLIKTDERTKIAWLPMSSIKPISGQLPQSAPISISAQKPKVETLPIASVQTIVITPSVPRERIRLKQPKEPLMARRFLIPTMPEPKFAKIATMKMPAFEVSAKRMGKYVKLGTFPYKLAVMKGIKATEHTPARSFKLKRAGFTQERDIPYMPDMSHYYSKGGALIERVKYAINTMGEYEGITLKGRRTKKKRRAKKR